MVFPLVPVIATTGAGQNQLATSSSLTTPIPFASASRTSGAEDGTPGLTTTVSASSTRRELTPNSYATPMASSAAAADRIFSGGALSLRNTAAPRAARSRATARPLRAPPRTLYRRPPGSDSFTVHLTLNVARLRIMRRIATI